MKRQLDANDVSLVCNTRHPAQAMRHVGYMSLKEAGAPATVLMFECTRCFRRLFVTDEGPVVDLAGIDATP